MINAKANFTFMGCACTLIFGACLSFDIFAAPPAPPPPPGGLSPYGAAGGAFAAGAIIGTEALQNGGNGSVTVGAPPAGGRNCQEITATYKTNNACGTGSYTYSTGTAGMHQSGGNYPPAQQVPAPPAGSPAQQ